MVEELLFGLLGFLLGGTGASLLWLRSRKEEPLEVPFEEISREKPRFFLAWKRGRIASDDMASISRKIEELRAANEPYDYHMDGRQIHSGRWKPPEVRRG